MKSIMNCLFGNFTKTSKNKALWHVEAKRKPHSNTMTDQAAEILRLKALLSKNGIQYDAFQNNTVQEEKSLKGSIVLNILASECQGGKTNKAIVVPVYRSLSQKEFPIVIIPPKIGLRQQTVSRVYGGPCFMDELDIPKEEKDNIKGIRLKSSQIGMWDTGCPANKRLDNIRETLMEIRKGWCKTVIALGNQAGISKVVALVYELLRREKTVQIFVDEAHSCLDIKLRKVDPDGSTMEAYEMLEETLVDITDDFDIVEGSFLKREYNLDQLWNWLIIKSITGGSTTGGSTTGGSLSISGVTATTAPLANNDYWRQSCLDINVTNMSPPSVYCGFDSFVKKKFSSKMGPESAFEKILDMEQEKAVVMFHAENRQVSHLQWGEKWIAECKEHGISPKRRGFFIDNGNGWCIYNGSGKEIASYKKSGEYTEPWQILKKLIVKHKKTHILITGKLCLNMSNTYQKCDNKDNIFVNHLVLTTPKKSLGNYASVQQEIGRMCSNDINNNERFLWTTKETRENLIRSYGLERHLRKMSTDQALNRVDYKRLVAMAKKDKFNVDGTLVSTPEQTGGEREQYENMYERFVKYRTANTCIAKFVRSIRAGVTYSKEEILNILKDAGYKQTLQILQSFIKSDNTFTLYILNEGPDGYTILKDLADDHKKAFGYN